MSFSGTSATQRYAQVALQTDYTTVGTLQFPLGEITDANRTWSRTQLTIEGTRSFEAVNEYHGMKEPAYTADFYLTNAKCLYLALGNSTPSGANPYIHILNGTATTLPYHQIEIIDLVDANSDFVTGCWVESLSLTSSQNSTVDVSMSGLGLDMSEAADSDIIVPGVTQNEGAISTIYNGEPFRFQHGAITLYDASSRVLSGVFHEIAINIENAILRGPAYGATTATYFTMQNRKITTSISLDIDSTTKPLIAALVDSETTFEIYWTLTRGVDDYIKFHFPSCKIFSFDKDYSDSVRTTLEIQIFNGGTPSAVPATVGTLPSASDETAWVIEAKDTIPDYTETSTT